MGRKKVMAHQTMIWFTEEDWALLDFIQEQAGLRTRADTVRLAIRELARKYDSGVVHRVTRRRPSQAGEQGAGATRATGNQGGSGQSGDDPRADQGVQPVHSV